MQIELKMQTDKRNCFFCVRNEITSPINITITLSLFFQKCYFTAWYGTYLFLVVERSKDITHVKLLPSLAAKILDICECKCEIHNTRHLRAA